MKTFWNEKYSERDYVYGKEPNDYLKNMLVKLEPGKILFPAEGEGRNAVFAAKQGWEVSAFDQSSRGQKKALLLAEEEGVSLDFQVTDLENYEPAKGAFDAIALIYAHFPPQDRTAYFQKLCEGLGKDGVLIFEGFGKKHQEYQKKNPAVGGPKKLSMLFSKEEVKEAFGDLEILEFYEGEVELSEGKSHKGKSWVIRFMAQKRGDS